MLCPRRICFRRFDVFLMLDTSDSQLHRLPCTLPLLILSEYSILVLQTVQMKRSVGLSTLALRLLGKPLDKSMQVSDWELRPLTARQVSYSAQDGTSLYAGSLHLLL